MKIHWLLLLLLQLLMLPLAASLSVTLILSELSRHVEKLGGSDSLYVDKNFWYVWWTKPHDPHDVSKSVSYRLACYILVSKQMLWECSELKACETCPGGLPRQILPHGWDVKRQLASPGNDQVGSTSFIQMGSDCFNLY